jgi:hypothetical protein
MVRCGTTLVASAICRRNILTYRDPGFLVNTSDLFFIRRGWVYKTHDFPNLEHFDNLKVIYMFCDPIAAAISSSRAFVGREKRASYHCHAPTTHDPRDALNRDIYRLEENFCAWYREQKFEFISVRYESLWDERARGILEGYLGRRLHFPKLTERKAKYEISENEDLLRVYGSLKRRIDAAEDVKIWKRIALSGV